MSKYRDSVTRRSLSAEQLANEQKKWQDSTHKIVEQATQKTARDLANDIYARLNKLSKDHRGERPPIPPCSHAPESNVVDHSFLTSAIVYCLASEHDQIHLIRLAALTHEFDQSERVNLKSKLAQPAEQELLDKAWQTIAAQEEQLEATASQSLPAMAHSKPDAGDELLNQLWYAHLAASQPLFNHALKCPDGSILNVVAKREDFNNHPLASIEQTIGIVYGGATKVKQYVFESAKLPEIRGGSVFLDRLNLDYSAKLFEYVPECIIYAAGGDVLALTPKGKAAEIALAIEAAYTRETLSAQSVAAFASVSLLELQYGVSPLQYWADDYTKDTGGARSKKLDLLYSYYGNPKHKNETIPDDQPKWTDEMCFHLRKCFGELVTHVALNRMRRRDGNIDKNAQMPARAVLHFETLPHGQFCSSCDRRTAVTRIPDLDDALCEPCLRKRWIGWRTRYGNPDDWPREVKRTEEAMRSATTWKPQNFEQDVGIDSFKAWHNAFQDYLDRALGNDALTEDIPSEIASLRNGYLDNVQGIEWEKRTLINGPKNVHEGIWPAYSFTEIGQAASPDGYIGIVSADGNNVGAIIERIRTPAEYRQFSQRLFDANQRAVFDALARHLRPAVVKDDKDNKVLIHPFEIISIGGDDLFLVVPAEKALPIALDISNTIEMLFAKEDAPHTPRAESYAQVATDAQRFRLPPLTKEVSGTAQTNQLSVTLPGRPGVSMSTGVVLAAHTTPFYFLTELAEELLKSAKQKAKKQREPKDTKKKGDYGSAIDFMALKSVSMVTTNVAAFRKIALTERKDNDILHLTARPYTTAEVARLVDAIKTLKIAEFPRSQLHQLREMLPQGRFATSLGYLYFTSRLKRGWTALLRRNLDDAWCDPTVDPAPWMRQEDQPEDQPQYPVNWETVLGDLIELYDFVPKPDGRPANQSETRPEPPQSSMPAEVPHG